MLRLCYYFVELLHSLKVMTAISCERHSTDHAFHSVPFLIVDQDS